MRTLAVLAVLALLTSLANADDKAAAEAMFVKGKRLMKDGDTAAACEQFEKSQGLDPQFGTQYNLALCYDALGRTASAWVIFRELAQLDTNGKRKKDSAKRAEALEPRLCKLLIVAPAGVVVSRDGIDVTQLVGVEEPVDPGTYRIHTAYWEAEVVVVEKGRVVTVEVPVEEVKLEKEKESGTSAAWGTARRGKGRKIAGIVVAGAGVVSTVVGLVFGAKAQDRWGQVKSLCGDDLSCETRQTYDQANALIDDARAAGNLSTALVGIGVAAIAVGVVLVVTAPSGSVEVAPTAGADAVGLAARGSF